MLVSTPVLTGPFCIPQGVSSDPQEAEPQPGAANPTGPQDISYEADPYAFLDSLCPPTVTRRHTELESYLSSASSSGGALEYWSQHETAYPGLARLAAVCLGAPASSGAVERLFSTAGSLQRARRASLLPRTIEQLILVAETIKDKEGLRY